MFSPFSEQFFSWGGGASKCSLRRLSDGADRRHGARNSVYMLRYNSSAPQPSSVFQEVSKYTPGGRACGHVPLGTT